MNTPTERSKFVSRRRFTTGLAGAAAGVIGHQFLTGANACCMVPRSYKGTISQSAQEGILFHKGDREELILRINYQLKGEGAPDRFAWVITVPNEPDRYAVADGELFREMFHWAEDAMFVKPRSFGFGAKSDKALAVPGSIPQGIELGKRVQVGPYDIQPVRALGAEALGALNEWLKNNGFPTEDPKHMAYFVENNFTFLAIKISPPKGEKTVRLNGEVEPLHLSFKSDKVYYPLRFSSRQGVFDLNLYVFTDKKFDYWKSRGALKKINLSSPSRLKKNVNVVSKSLPKSLRDQLGKTAADSIKAAANWKANLVRTHQTNRDNAIASWEEDVFFTLRS
jgi:hypothetical protein